MKHFRLLILYSCGLFLIEFSSYLRGYINLVVLDVLSFPHYYTITIDYGNMTAWFSIMIMLQFSVQLYLGFILLTTDGPLQTSNSRSLKVIATHFCLPTFLPLPYFILFPIQTNVIDIGGVISVVMLILVLSYIFYLPWAMYRLKTYSSAQKKHQRILGLVYLISVIYLIMMVNRNARQLIPIDGNLYNTLLGMGYYAILVILLIGLRDYDVAETVPRESILDDPTSPAKAI